MVMSKFGHSTKKKYLDASIANGKLNEGEEKNKTVHRQK